MILVLKFEDSNINFFVCPSSPREEIDEDSGGEDDGGDINNFTSHQLNSPCLLNIIPSKKKRSRI